MPNVVGMKTEKFQLKVKCLKKAASYALISAFPGGVDPRDIRGNSAGFADFCCQFLARDGGIGPLLHPRGKMQGERPRGFVTLPPS